MKLREEPGYEVWANAALRAADESLRKEEAKRPYEQLGNAEREPES